MFRKNERRRPRIKGSCIPVLILAAGLCSGCLSLGNELELKKDGSGLLTMVYELSPEMLSLCAGDSALLPFPLHEDDFKRVAVAGQGLVLKDYRKKVDADSLSIRAVVSFQSLSSLSHLWGDEAQYMRLKPSAEGGELELTIPAVGKGIEPDSRQLLQEFFTSEFFTYTITVPGNIKSFNAGKLSGDRTFHYQISIYDIFKLEADKKILISW